MSDVSCKKNSIAHLCAFTLIELVLTILILGIISVSAVPKFLSLNDFYAATFNDNVQATIMFAQKIAIGTGCDVEVGLSNNTVSLMTRSNCTSGDFTVAISDPGYRSSSYIITAPNGVTITSSSFPIYFDSLGRAKLVSDDSVSNASISTGSLTVNIVGETGYAYSS